jgi:hypothetical protein
MQQEIRAIGAIGSAAHLHCVGYKFESYIAQIYVKIIKISHKIAGFFDS